MKAKRKILFTITLILFVTGTLYIPSPFVTIVSGLEGGGTEGNPYLIKTAADLQEIGTGSYGLDDYYKLNNDIDMTSIPNFTPLGKFYGTLDGNFKNISNLKISAIGNNVGLFSETSGATIKNLGIVNANVTSAGSDIAILVGNDDGGTSVSRTYVTGTVSGGAAVGGFFGSTHGRDPSDTIIENSYVRANLIRGSSVKDTSGFAGWNYATSISITNSYSASIGEVRPIAGWSDGLGGVLDISRLDNTYYDETLSPSLSSGYVSLGKTSSELEIQSTFTDNGWNFTDIWDIDPNKNGGYPYLRGFENLPDPPGSIVVTLTTDGVGSDGARVPKTDASVTIKKGSEEITLQHQGGGVYSTFASGGTWNVFVGDAQIGTAEVTDGKSTTLTQYIEKFVGTLTITGNAVFGQELKANLTGNNNTGDLSYQWKRGDLNIASATGTTYTLTEEDIGRTIKVECTSTSPAGSIESDSTSQVTKATQSPPSISMSSSYNSAANNYTVSISSVAGAQYSFNGTSWSSTNTTTIATDSTEVTGYIRMAETDTHFTSTAVSTTRTTGTDIKKAADTKLIEDAEAVVVNGSVTVPFGAIQDDITRAVQSYVNGKLTGDLAAVGASVSYNSIANTYTVTFSIGEVTDTKVLSMTVQESPDPDIEAVNKIASSISNFSLPVVPQSLGFVSPLQFNSYVLSMYSTLSAADPTVGVKIVSDSLILPKAGTRANPLGVDGMYSYEVEISKNDQVQIISEELVIKASTYVELPETGDSAPISLLCLLMLLSVAGISGVYYYRKQICS